MKAHFLLYLIYLRNAIQYFSSYLRHLKINVVNPPDCWLLGGVRAGLQRLWVGIVNRWRTRPYRRSLLLKIDNFPLR